MSILMFALILVMAFIEYRFFINVRSAYVGIPILRTTLNNYQLKKTLQIKRSQVIAGCYKSKDFDKQVRITAKCIGEDVFLHYTHPVISLSLTTGIMINPKTGNVRIHIPVMIVVYHLYLMLLIPFLVHIYNVKASGIEFILIPFIASMIIMLKIDLKKYMLFDALIKGKKILAANNR